MVQTLWKIVYHFILKLKMQLLYDPAMALLGIYLREIKTYVHAKTYI